MIHKLVDQTWWLSVLSLIFVSALLAMVVLYKGVFSTLAGTFVAGALELAAGFVLMISTIVLAKYRADLI